MTRHGASLTLTFAASIAAHAVDAGAARALVFGAAGRTSRLDRHADAGRAPVARGTVHISGAVAETLSWTAAKGFARLLLRQRARAAAVAGRGEGRHTVSAGWRPAGDAGVRVGAATRVLAIADTAAGSTVRDTGGPGTVRAALHR